MPCSQLPGKAEQPRRQGEAAAVLDRIAGGDQRQQQAPRTGARQPGCGRRFGQRHAGRLRGQDLHDVEPLAQRADESLGTSCPVSLVRPQASCARLTSARNATFCIAYETYVRNTNFWREDVAKFQPLRQAVRDNLSDGDTAAFEGFTHLIPTAAAHEAIRQGFADLTLIRMTPDLVYDQMIGMGMAKKLVFSYAGNPGVGLLRRCATPSRTACRMPLEIEEHCHAAMANAYEAGAAGLPCAIFRGYRGAELAKVNPNIKSVDCPFTGELLAAVPAIRPDVTFIHAQKANRKGNVLVEGIVGVQKEAVLAAKRAVVTVEEVVDDFDDLHPNLCVLPHWTVTAIAVVPGGAHPSYTHGYYDRDNAAYLEWDEIAADRDRFLDWMDEQCHESRARRFRRRVAHLRNAA